MDRIISINSKDFIKKV